MDAEIRHDFKALLLAQPFWDETRDRRAFLRDLFAGHPLYDGLILEGKPATVASDLVDLCDRHAAYPVGGRTPCRALLHAIRQAGATAGELGNALDRLEQALRPTHDEAPKPKWHGEPYPGLDYFDHTQAPIFFGRETETQQLIERLQTQRGQRLLIVTGASGNLGAGVARSFAAGGANLVLVDRHIEALQRVGFADDARHLLSVTDLLDQVQVSAMVQAAVAKFGGVHVLCNIAGGFRMGEAVHETSDATWNFLFDINARTLLHAARAVVPQMLAQSLDAAGCRGKVINVGAFGAQRGGAQMGAYAASKAGVMRLTESMAAELREQGINVNAVLPTIIDTPQNRADMPGADPVKWVSTEALADVILFLSSRAARSVHGALVPVTGLS